MSKNILLSHLRTVLLSLGAAFLIGGILASALDYPNKEWHGIVPQGASYSRFTNILVGSSVPTDGTVKNSVRLGGSTAADMQYRITGTCPVYQPIRQIYHDGTVRCDEILFAWSGAGFGTCTSALGCGMGTQTQVVNCVDDSGSIVDESNCTSYLPPGSKPVASQSCNTGIPCACAPASRTIATHTYSVPSIGSGSSQLVTSAPVAIANGSCTYRANFSCSSTTLISPGSDMINTPCTCNAGYSWSGATSSCVSVAPPPSCTDGIQNGTETGIDCGGSCSACAAPPPSAPGVCGSCSGYVEAPTCWVGTVIGATANDTTKQWTWTCQGVSGGANSPTCTALAVPTNYNSGMGCVNELLGSCDFGTYYSFNVTSGVGARITKQSCFSNSTTSYQWNWNPITDKWDYISNLGTTGGAPRACMLPC